MNILRQRLRGIKSATGGDLHDLQLECKRCGGQRWHEADIDHEYGEKVDIRWFCKLCGQRYAYLAPTFRKSDKKFIKFKRELVKRKIMVSNGLWKKRPDR